MFIKNNDNLSLYVNTSGNDLEPLLFIHGGPGAWSYSFEYFAKDYIKEFANGIYLDQRGCGRSEGDYSHEYSLDAILDDIECVRKSLNYERISILAHSFGGIIAVNYAHKYQNHVNKLILSNCTLDLYASLKEQVDFGYQLLNEEPHHEELMDSFQYMYQKLNELNLWNNLQFKDVNSFHLINKIDEGIKNHTFNGMALNIPDYFNSLFDLTKEITVPTLVISGNGDYSVGPNHYKNFQFPNAFVAEMNTKHVPFIEDQEEYFKIIKDFILTK